MHHSTFFCIVPEALLLGERATLNNDIVASMVAFVVLSVLAIAGGGLLMAFSARRASWYKSWASAYLVLVAGLIQLGLISSWLALGRPDTGLAVWAFIAYNVANCLVLAGTAYKRRFHGYSLIVNLGGLLLALAMVLLLLSIRNLNYSWTFDGLVILAIIILASAPMGLVMSSDRKRLVKS